MTFRSIVPLSVHISFFILFCVTDVFALANEKIVIAKVISAKGLVFAQSGSMEKRKLKRRSKIYSEDTILTSKSASTQIRFSDGSLISLEQESEFTISEYTFNNNEDDKVIFNLLEGKLRTITGKIGKKTKKNYQMKTPVATIGIRGTHYVINVCQLRCSKRHQDKVKQGLYGGVYEGSILTSNSKGNKGFNKDEFFFVETKNSKPDVLLQVPQTLRQQVDNPENKLSKKTEEEVIEALPEDTNGIVEITPQEAPLISGPLSINDTLPLTQVDVLTETIKEGVNNLIPKEVSEFHSDELSNIRAAPSGSFTAIAMSYDNLSNNAHTITELMESGVDGQANLGEILPGPDNLVIKVEDNLPPCNPCMADVKNAYLLDDGGDPLGLNWGRWRGNISVEDQFGLQNIDDTNLHYIYIGKITPIEGIPISGVYRFNYVGGTRPTSNKGHIGSILPGTGLTIDFSALTMNADINVKINNKILNASGMKAFSTSGKNIMTLTGTCSGCSQSLLNGGEFKTILVGDNGEGAAGPFSIDTSDEDVSGVIFLKR
ncbi:MAG: FecR domain-containing protein [Gammaproteobacteria bacterium]|nr:FecR domain-containing protein [Gammaproteobacteria bacterium]